MLLGVCTLHLYRISSLSRQQRKALKLNSSFDWLLSVLCTMQSKCAEKHTCNFHAILLQKVKAISIASKIIKIQVSMAQLSVSTGLMC